MLAKTTCFRLRARGGLFMLCLLIAASISMRMNIYLEGSKVEDMRSWEASGAHVDLGRGVLMPRVAARPLALRARFCPTLIAINFIAVSPYEADPTPIGAPQLGDHVFYFYHGVKLDGRFITVGLNVIYFTRRAYARLTMRRNTAADDLAVKVIVPASCDTSPEDVMTALRRQHSLTESIHSMYRSDA